MNSHYRGEKSDCLYEKFDLSLSNLSEHKQLVDYYNKLNYYIKNAPKLKHSTVLIRGIKKIDNFNFIKGEIYTLPHPISTSQNYHVALQFSGDDGYICRYHLPKNISVCYIGYMTSMLGNEYDWDEILIQGGLSFKCTGISKMYIDLEYIHV